MGVKEVFKEYMSNYEKEEILKILFENSMMNILGDEYLKLDDVGININRLWANYNWRRTNEIFRTLEGKGVNYIVFKGIVISQLLYDDPYKRDMGDIDFFVDEKNFNVAKEVLKQLGFYVMKAGGEDNPHHITYTDSKVIIELHKSILTPLVGIDENYIRRHTTRMNIAEEEIVTFDKTATILHLIYHLYMDMWLTCGSIYSILTNKKLPKTRRFLYRAYEIALFLERYSAEINWVDMQRDLKKQKFRICFKKMIIDICEIFPDSFSESFIQMIFQLDYVDDERDRLYKFLIDSEIKEHDKNMDYILSNYINENWETRREKNIYRKVGEKISLAKKSSNEIEQGLKCDIVIQKITNGLKIIFEVSNEDFFISDSNNYDTQTSDGVHLLLCGTEKYSYNSIFFFPKEINGSIKVVVCDVLNNRNIVFDDTLIRAEFLKTNRTYTIKAVLCNEFIEKNHLASYFYMGLVVSDCSSKTKRRKNQLILSEEDSQWYNPTYFAKIDMK